MNSHQRRRNRRQVRYVVEHTWRGQTWNERVAEHQEIVDWCRKQFGNRSHWRNITYSTRWEFDCSKRATLFALRWS